MTSGSTTRTLPAPPGAQGRDRVRPRPTRPRRDHLRSRGRGRPERDRRLQRVPRAATTGRSGCEYEGRKKSYEYGLSKNLRDGDQQRPVLRLMRCNHRRPEAGDGPRLRPLRLLQVQRVLRPHHAEDDGRDRQPAARIRRYANGSARTKSGVRRPVHVDRRPHRHILGRHPPPRRPLEVRFAPKKTQTTPTTFAEVQVEGYGRVREPATSSGLRRRSGRSSRTSRCPPPERPEKDVLFPHRARPAQELAARRAQHHPRRGVLPRPQGRRRSSTGLGLVLAQLHRGAKVLEPSGSRSRRPPLRHDGDQLAPAQPVQGRHRVAARDMGGGWNMGSSAPSGTTATTWTSRTWTRAARPRPQEDLRGRRVHSDITFIGVLTPEFCKEHTACSRSTTRTRRSTSSKAANSRRSSSACCTA